MRTLLVLALLFLCVTTVAPAQESKSFVPVWIDKDAVLSAEALDAALAAVAARQAEPPNIVLLVHGFDVPRDDSAQQFETVGRLVLDEFAKQGQEAVVVGVQWASDVDVSLLDLPTAYLETVPVARNTGRQGVRQLLLGLEERFPKANLSVMAHSMGCEVSGAAVAHEARFKEGSAPVLEAFRPDRPVHLDLLTMAGSDLDYDAFASSGLQLRQDDPRVRMMWMTLSPVVGDKDQVLKMRALMRGKAAGNVFPKMTEQQYDAIFASKAAYFDNEGIPKSHDFLKYYDEARVAQLVPAMLWLADAKSVPEPVAFREMDAVVAAPAKVEALLPYLDSPHLNTQLYALWRLEGILCGGSGHIANEFLPEVGAMLRDTPREILRVRRSEDCPCETVKKGYWPTSKTMTRAGAPPWAAP